jgi:hypothetical protein
MFSISAKAVSKSGNVEEFFGTDELPKVAVLNRWLLEKEKQIKIAYSTPFGQIG